MDVFSVDSVLAATKTWKGSADVLDEIFLGSSGEQLDEADLVLFSLNPNFTAPKLRVYVLYDMYCTQDVNRLPQLFPALEELSMVRTAFHDVSTSGQLMELLKPLRSLRSLNFCDPQSNEDDDVDGDEDEEGEATSAARATCLSPLTELELQEMTSGELNGFFKALSAPHLKTLSLSKCDIDPDALPHLRRQLSRFPSLDTVRLYMNNLKVAHISEFFSAFTHLHLILTPLDELFASLKVRPRGEWSFPRLTSIELHTTTGFPSHLLREIVETRRTASGAGAESGSPLALESITVYSDASISEEDRSWFKDNLRAFVWSDTTSYKGADACTVKLICAPPN